MYHIFLVDKNCQKKNPTPVSLNTRAILDSVMINQPRILLGNQLNTQQEGTA